MQSFTTTLRTAAIAVIPLLALSGCSKTFPVTGSVPRTGEQFIGTATSEMTGKSAIQMTTDKGVKCAGEYIAPVVFAPTEGSSGDGSFRCDDGRTGTFSFTGDTISGQGFGRMNNGDKFNFTYGNARLVKVQ